jgi:threonine 3-dehydrogenase
VCGVCRNCRAGKQHLCPNTVGIGVNRAGAFAEYIAMPASNLWPIPDQIPSELAAFFDPYGNAAHCALEFDVIGEDVLITGAGPIGIIAAGICKHVGARNVVVTDVNDYRLKLAADMGATRVVNVSKQSLKDVVKDLHMEGFDVGLEMSGNPRAFNDMLECMYHGGKIALLGILPKGAGIDWDKIIFKGLTMQGIYGRRMYETWYKMTQMVLSGLPLQKVLTHQIHIDDFQKGFDLMEAGNCGKVVCSWMRTHGDALEQVARNPLQTLADLPQGVARYFNRRLRRIGERATKLGDRAARSLKEDGNPYDAVDSAMSAGRATSPTDRAWHDKPRRELLNLARSELDHGRAIRAWAQRLGIDPDTRNPLIRPRLEALGWVAVGGDQSAGWGIAALGAA